MTIFFCSAIGILFAISIYLFLSRNILRFVMGIAILTSSVNIFILMAGRITSFVPPFVQSAQIKPEESLANPLPQALILTAIVIGFGLLVFSLVLVRVLWQRIDSVDSNEFNYAERIYYKKRKEIKNA